MAVGKGFEGLKACYGANNNLSLVPPRPQLQLVSRTSLPSSSTDESFNLALSTPARMSEPGLEPPNFEVISRKLGTTAEGIDKLSNLSPVQENTEVLALHCIPV